jgi:hypothetical protein
MDSLIVTLREEHRLKVVEKRVLKRIFVHKGDEVIGRKLCNEGFIICTLQQII